MFTLRHLGILSTALGFCLFSSGCATLSAKFAAYWECKTEQHALKRQMLADNLEACKQQLEADRAAMKAQNDHDLACRKAQLEEDDCKLKSQMEESVRTQIGLDFDQRVSVGQLQVDMASLKSLMAERELELAEQMEIYNSLKADERKAQRENWKKAQTQPSCSCAHPQCAVPATSAGPTCEAPHGRGCCLACGLPTKPQHSNDCAGTRPFKQPPTKPIEAPLAATEIPLMLPVRLEMGITNSQITKSQVRRLPTRSQHQPCGQCPSCASGQPCHLYTPPACDVPQAPPSSAKRESASKGETLPAHFEIPADE